jgi:membrane associated rhomboid family serine protease
MTEFRPGRFQILPVIIKNLLIINGLVFLAQLTLDGIDPRGDLSPKTGALMDLFALHHILSPLFKPWQLLTHMFMHGGLMHIFGNMFALWMFGSILENLWGPKKFLVFYILCGLGAAVLHLASLYYESMPLLADLSRFKAQPNPETFRLFFEKNQVNSQEALDFLNKILYSWGNNSTDPTVRNQAINAVTDYTNQQLSEPTVGASGAVFGCLAAFGYLFPNNYIYLYFFVPMKAKWFVILYIGLELYWSYQNSAGDNVAHIAHLGGALVGFLLVFFWNRTNRRQFY